MNRTIKFGLILTLAGLANSSCQATEVPSASEMVIALKALCHEIKGLSTELSELRIKLALLERSVRDTQTTLADVRRDAQRERFLNAFRPNR